MPKRPKGNAKREAWISYSDGLEAELADLMGQLEAAKLEAQHGADGAELRQLRRRIHQLTGGRG